jgi:hypothetical protein
MSARRRRELNVATHPTGGEPVPETVPDSGPRVRAGDDAGGPAETTTSTSGADTEALTRRLIAALRGLPTWGHHEVLRERLTAMLARHEQTGDLSEFEHFTESLVMTARMERSPAFLATAAEDEPFPVESRDILDVIQRIEARRDDSRT